MSQIDKTLFYKHIKGDHVVHIFLYGIIPKRPLFPSFFPDGMFTCVIYNSNIIKDKHEELKKIQTLN